MADYKRMVSYMYQYENGVKRKNVGYARIESKSGQCKITLHMQLLGQLDSIFPTYLIHRDHDGMELIYLGDTLLKNQIMDSRLTADDTNIMDSGLALAEMGGLLLFLNDKVFFASDWDDKPIVAEEVLEALKPKPKKPMVALEPEYAENKIHVADTPLKVNEPVETEQDHDISYLSPDDQMKLPKYKLPRGWKTVERLQKTYSDLIYDNKEQILEAADITAEYKPEQAEFQNVDIEDIFMESRDIFASNVIAPDNEMSFSEKEEEYITEDGLEEETGTEPFSDTEDKLEEDNETDMQAESMTASEELGNTEEQSELDLQAESMNCLEELDNAEEQSDTDTQSEGMNASEELHSAEEQSDTDTQANSMNATEVSRSMDQQKEIDTPQNQIEDLEFPDHPTAKRLFDHYPRIYPFEDNDILLCVKIEPKDIGLLPKDVWTYSNNSFLMHGYYCYHHLIFAKMKDRYGCHYILGIPGIYHNREQFMAKMFGFENFKSIRKRDLRQGDFGYWYLPINF